MEPLSTLTVFIPSLFSIQDFSLFGLFTNYLKSPFLEFTSFLAIENLTSSYANFNLTVLTLSSFGLIWFLFWHLLVKNDKIPNKNMQSKWHEYTNKNGDRLIQKLQWSRNTLYKLILLLVLVFLSLIFYLLMFQNYSMNDKQHLVFLLINFQVIPGMYLFLENKREIIFITYLISIGLCGKFIIENVY